MACFTLNPVLTIVSAFTHNYSGGPLTYALHVVPDGEVAVSSNLLESGSVATLTSAVRSLMTNAAAGTKIVLNSSGAGGIAWLNVWELDAP
jgi:hypothetical protein